MDNKQFVFDTEMLVKIMTIYQRALDQMVLTSSRNRPSIRIVIMSCTANLGTILTKQEVTNIVVNPVTAQDDIKVAVHIQDIALNCSFIIVHSHPD
ncbi:TPA: hypothetical protein ACH3X1_016730 [Trebouxia sp. C0004]